MDRHWLITWTTYGTWLPGDQRGFVGTVVDPNTKSKEIENIPGTPYLENKTGLQLYAESRLKCDPIFLTREQAKHIATQFEETADYRGWKLHAFAVM